MENQIVIKEVAQLAKDKGFNEVTTHYYDKDGVIVKRKAGNLPAPFQTHLQRWLWEKHRIWISIKIVTRFKKEMFDLIAREVVHGPDPGTYLNLTNRNNPYKLLEEGLFDSLGRIQS